MAVDTSPSAATILAGRPNKNPGLFKESANRADNTAFVLPGLVDGTLRAGWSRLAELDTPFERAAYTMFLVSEVHPFDDDNGRVSRVMMNAELVAGAQTRIIVPTVFREDYLDGLRMLSRQKQPGVLIKALRYAHDYKESGEKDERIWGVGAWRESPYFSTAERAALALAECVTRLADRPDPVPDTVWDDAADLYDEKELSSLVLSIAAINFWNRLNAATRQPAGQAW